MQALLTESFKHPTKTSGQIIIWGKSEMMYI